MSKSKKTHSMHIRFSESEFETLKKSADVANISIAEYVRTTSVRKQEAPSVKKIAITPAEDFKRSLREIAAVGSNLNQIAASLNRNGDFREKALLDALKTLIAQTKQLKNDIAEIRGRMI